MLDISNRILYYMVILRTAVFKLYLILSGLACSLRLLKNGI